MNELINELIKVSQRRIGDTTVQSVNARELHAFLEVGRVFAAWIQERIAQYEFTEHVDYEVFSGSGNNLAGGRPAKEYAITLDMAKELSMVERNVRGKQARQYFIECERRLLVSYTPAPVTNVVAHAIQGFDIFTKAFDAISRYVTDKNAAAISANQSTIKLTGFNLLELSGTTHLLADQQVRWYTPTEIGREIGWSAKRVNDALRQIGVQHKTGGQWEAVGKGVKQSRVFDTGKKHKTGTPVTQLKWNSRVLGQFRKCFDAGVL